LKNGTNKMQKTGNTKKCIIMEAQQQKNHALKFEQKTNCIFLQQKNENNF